jgi:transposase
LSDTRDRAARGVRGRLSCRAHHLVAYLEHKIEGTDAWAKQRRDELVGELRATPALFRFVRRSADGLLRIDKGAVTNEARFDGKFLLRTSDDTLSPSDLALGYKQLYEVERGWRDLKDTLKLRPVFYFREDRIRAHVQLCWLALLLIRTVEHETGDTWRNVRNELDRMHLVTIETAEGRVAQRSATTPRQVEILRKLDIAEPARFYDFELPSPVA